MSSITVAPLKQIRVSRHQIPSHGLIPNTSIQNKPLYIYQGVFQPSVSASNIETHLTSVGVVVPQWRFTMYSQTHFHSTTHEVLCISHGRAKLCFGGEDNSGAISPTVSKGDVIVVPAGVAHWLLNDEDGSFEMVLWETGRGREGCEHQEDCMVQKRSNLWRYWACA